VDFDAPELTADTVTALMTMIAQEQPDSALIFTSYHQSPLPLALICRMAGVSWTGAICEDYPGSLLNLRHHVADGVPEPLRALSLAVAAGWRLPFGDDGRLRLRRLPPLHPSLSSATAGHDYVAFHPGAAVPARRPSAHSSAEIARALAAAGHFVVVTGTEADRVLTAQVAGDDGLDLGGHTTLAELASVFASARAVVAPNTGPAHLAAAVGTPVVSLFAPVVPAGQWAPYGTIVVLLGDQDAPCRLTRARECAVPGHPCLNGIAPADVVAAVADVQSRGAA
jgi:ADP-heptose:LPS heptosyltransferase